MPASQMRAKGAAAAALLALGAAGVLLSHGPVMAAEVKSRSVPQLKCSKGQYRFDPRLYRCLEVTVYETRNGKRVPRIYFVWKQRHARR